MPYDPHVQNRADEFLMQGISMAGQGIADGIKEMKKRREENDFFTQQARDLAGKTGPDGQPLMTAEMLQKAETGSLSQKKALVSDALFNLNNAYKSQEAQMSQAQLGLEGARVGMEGQQMSNDQLRLTQEQDYRNKDLAMRQEELDRLHPAAPFTPQMVPMKDPQTGQTFYSVTTSRESAVPLHSAQAPGSGGDAPTVSPDGKYYWDGKKWEQYKTPAGKAAGGVDQRAMRIQAIDQEMGKLRGDAASHQRDLSGKPGPLGMFGSTYQTQLDALQKERDTLVAGMQSDAAPAGASGSPSTPAAVQTPAQARQLDPATAQQFLQQANGDKAKARQMAAAAGYSF